MKTIWKYLIPLSSGSTIHMPRHTEVLCVHEQDNVPYLWALVDPSETKYSTYHFNIYETGQRIHNDSIDDPIGAYIGTIRMQRHGPYLVHVFLADVVEDD